MDKGTLNIVTMKIKRARHQWAQAQTEFTQQIDRLMALVINEAAVNRMSAEEIAAMLGITPKRVRVLMRAQGLDPYKSKTLLAEHAAANLKANADLLGIDVREMDLMSPLVYLPAGEQLRATVLADSAAQVTEDEFEGLADTVYEQFPWEGESYQAVAEHVASALLNAGWRK